MPKKLFKNILISFIFFIIGIFAALFVFFGSWSVIFFIVTLFIAETKAALLLEILFLLNFIASFYFLAFLAVKFFAKKLPGKNIFLSLPICLPITLLLLLFAALTDSSQKEFIFRFAWIAAPSLTYLTYLIYKYKKKI